MDKVADNIQRLQQDDDLATVKDIVCPFYNKGKDKHPDCFGCPQNVENLVECKETYLTKIKKKPQLEWTPSFDELIKRDRKSPQDIEIGLKCDSCYMSSKCPLYQVNTACGIDWTSDAENVTKSSDRMEYLIKLQMKRVQRGTIIEELDGGVADQLVSSEIDRLNNLIRAKNDLDNVWSVKVEAKGNNNQSPGILAQLFGGKKETEQPTIPVQEVTKQIAAQTVEPVVEIPFTKEKVKIKKT